jgi:hypothetical protein
MRLTIFLPIIALILCSGCNESLPGPAGKDGVDGKDGINGKDAVGPPPKDSIIISTELFFLVSNVNQVNHTDMFQLSSEADSFYAGQDTTIFHIDYVYDSIRKPKSIFLKAKYNPVGWESRIEVSKRYFCSDTILENWYVRWVERSCTKDSIIPFTEYIRPSPIQDYFPSKGFAVDGVRDKIDQIPSEGKLKIYYWK